MKRGTSFYKLSALLLTLLLIATGCGGGGNDNNNGGGKSGGKKVKLTMSAWGNPEELKVYQRAIDAYEKENPNVTVKLVSIPSDNYEQKLMTQLQGGQAPDVFYMGNEYTSKMAQTGKVAKLNDFLASDDSYVKEDEFSEGIWGAAKLGDDIYGLPVDCNPYLLYYNKNVLKDAGIDISPQEHFENGTWNWDTFADMTAKIKNAGKRGYIIDRGSVHTQTWAWSNGGKLFDEEGNFILSKDKKAQEAIRYVADNVKAGNFTYGGSLPKGQGADAMFMSNQVGFVAAGRWLTPMFSQNKSLEFDYIPFPTNTGNKMEPGIIATANMGVAKDSKHLNEALKFATYYNSKEGQVARLKNGGNAIPSISTADKEVMANAKVPEHASYLVDARNVGRADAQLGAVPSLDKEIADIMDLLLLNKADVNTTIDNIQKKADEIIADYRESK